MSIKKLGFVGLTALGILIASGCKKSEPPPAAAQSQPATPAPRAAVSSNAVVRIHWRGIKQIASESNAAGFTRIWNMPETKRLEDQTLDRLGTNFELSTFNFQLSSSNSRPLLDDLVQSECYVEIRQATNETPEAVLAIRLSSERARAWNALTLSRSHAPTLVFPSGEWTLVGLSPGATNLAQELAARIKEVGRPFTPSSTNFWLEVNLDLGWIATAFSVNSTFVEGLPKLSLNVIGDGSNVVSSGELDFPKPIPFALEPWNVPTNLMHGPVHSFSALQGIGAWLGSWKPWQDLQAGAAPNQFYAWSQQASPVFSYVAAPLNNASNAVVNMSDHLVEAGNPWMATNGSGDFQRSTVAAGLEWTAARPLMALFLQSVSDRQGDAILAGFGRSDATNQPIPAPLLQRFLEQTNLVYYDREVTGAEIQRWLYLTQALRMVFWKAQLPPESAGVPWLQALERVVSDSTTTVKETGPAQLSFTRTSSVGFTGLELQLVADWVEAPRFPLGLHTLQAPGVPRPKGRPKHNPVQETPKQP